MLKSITTAIFIAVSALSAFGTTVDFSYNSTDASPYGYGYKKMQTYDVAVLLNSPDLVGKEITGLSVPIYATEYVYDSKVWLSSQLSTHSTSSVFTPDIAIYDATIINGQIDFSFPKPFTIPEDGVYIGYTLEISGADGDKKVEPIAVVNGKTSGGFWLHATESQKKWADMTVRADMVSAMTLHLSGNFPKNAASVVINSEKLYIAKNEPSVITATITNWGIAGIKSINYNYTLNGSNNCGTYEFKTPVPSTLGRMAKIDIAIAPFSTKGDFLLEFDITKVNEHDNEVANSSAIVPVVVQSFVPTYRPLVEEYTGLHCGYCPRGYVMLEQMNYYYGDLFVGMAYHSSNYENGAMVFIPDVDFPDKPSTYPAVALNRSSIIDPDNLPKLWNSIINNVTPAEIAVDLEWENDLHHNLVAKAHARFIDDIPESDYLLSFALVADNLSNPQWGQSNSYAGFEANGEYTKPFWDLFVGQDSKVYGLKFNDVVCHFSGKYGIDGSLPASVDAEEWYEFSYIINVNEIVNEKGEKVIDNFDRTRVIAIIVNKKTGKPLNCISSTYPDGSPHISAVKSLNDSASVVDEFYIDFQGRKIYNPSSGLYIRCQMLSNGTMKTSKIMIK